MKSEDSNLSPKRWWLLKRLEYNKGLLYAGIVAFALYCMLGPICIEPHEELEETIFEMAFQGVLYLMAICIANCFYTLGSFFDILFNRDDNPLFRQHLFFAGYWFSMILPSLLTLYIMLWHVFHYR